MNVIAKVVLSTICVIHGRAALGGDANRKTVSGNVVGIGGDSLGTAEVALYSPLAVFEVATDPQGAFVFDDIPAGHYELQAIAKGTKRTVMEIHVAAEALSPKINVTLSFATSFTTCEGWILETLPSYRALDSKAGAQLGGVLRASKNKSLDGADVKLLNRITREEWSSHTGHDGSFVFRFDTTRTLYI